MSLSACKIACRWLPTKYGPTSEETLFLRFTDDGKPYDPTAAPEPDTTLTADERKIGGLGLHMVRKMTTSMTYQYSGAKNSLTLGFTLI